jgi:Mechanosensitive ion channel
VDLQERRQLDVASKVQHVRSRARPWRSMIALALAIAGAVAAEFWGVRGWGALHSPGHQTEKVITLAGGLAFLIFGLAAAVGLSSRARMTLQPLVGQAHAGVVRYVLVLIGVFAILTITLVIVRVPVGQLLVGGAVTAVVLGIAAQQSLANLFAGLVLLFARPFRVGDRVRFRAGALSGQIEGVITDISLTYVRLESDEGRVLVPNAQALAAAVLLGPDGPNEAVTATEAVTSAGAATATGAVTPAQAVTSAGVVTSAGADSTAGGGTPADGVGPAETAVADEVVSRHGGSAS